MKLKHHLLLAAFLLIGSWTNTQAQLFIDDTYTAEEMVLDFFSNSCVTPSNITYTGATGTYAFFDAGNTNLDAQAGIYLGSGFATGAIGPNNDSGSTAITQGGSDTDLETLTPDIFTFDAAVLEMDIVASGDQLDFSYIFASEEYPEFVNSGFNDIFAFFISGPGITGIQNIAMIPNSSDPVSINTINDQQNSQYYIDNSGGTDIQFDGYTTELIASATVVPNETYHIKIAIADVGDSTFDSGIFLGIESLCGDSLLVPPANFSYWVDGLSLTVENISRYATSNLWDFGDNTTSTEKNPDPHVYATAGYYDVTLITQNYCCSDTLTTQVTVGNPTGVDDIVIKPYLLSPNPINDFAQITFDNGSLFEVKIFDAAGQLILQQKGSGYLELEFHDLAVGVYLMEVFNEGKTFRDKFLKL